MTAITSTAAVKTVRPKSSARRSPSALALHAVAEAHEDRDEGRRETGRDEDVEGDLGDPEGRVVGVELRPGPEGVGEEPVANEAHAEVAERQEGEGDRAAREDPVQEVASEANEAVEHRGWVLGDGPGRRVRDASRHRDGAPGEG